MRRSRAFPGNLRRPAFAYGGSATNNGNLTSETIPDAGRVTGTKDADAASPILSAKRGTGAAAR